MIIAVATNDRKTLAKRTGRAKEFAFYTIENGKIMSIRYEKNEHEHHHDHDHHNHEPNHRKVSGYGRHHGQGMGRGRGMGHHRHSHYHEEHEGEHTHDEVVQQLKNVDLFLVKAVGKYMRKDLENGNIPFKVVKKGDNIDEVIQDYLKS